MTKTEYCMKRDLLANRYPELDKLARDDALVHNWRESWIASGENLESSLARLCVMLCTAKDASQKALLDNLQYAVPTYTVKIQSKI